MQNEATKILLEAIKQGRKPALQTVFDLHYAEVCRAIYKLVPDAALMEDLAQEVFIRFWEKREQIEVLESIGGYLHRMAVNEALAHLRRRRFFEDVSEAAHLPAAASDHTETDVLHQDLSLRLQAALNTLPPRCRAVFQLSRFEEMSYREIADQMDISIKTVENQMGKALKLLREQLSEFLQWRIFQEILQIPEFQYIFAPSFGNKTKEGVPKHSLFSLQILDNQW